MSAKFLVPIADALSERFLRRYCGKDRFCTDWTSSPKAAHFDLQKAIALGVLKAIGFCNGALAYDFGLLVW
jgi:hypothetical protein